MEGNIKAQKNQIKLPIFGWVKISEEANFQGIKNAVISRKGEHWFVSFKIPFVAKKTEKKTEIIGVDLGIKTLATLSDGCEFKSVRPYKRHKQKLKKLQRAASKKFKKGEKEQSKNYQKTIKKISNLHYKITCIRQDSLHKLTTYLAKNHSHIVIEDLNVQGMSKNHRLASAILDGGFYEFRRQLTYKCEWYGSGLTVADRFFASSKTCSNCGEKKSKLSLKERIFSCEFCDYESDRDLNAAKNLEKYGASYAL